MSSNEGKNNLAKIVLVISIMLLAAVLINMFFPGLLLSTSTTSTPSSQEDLESVYDQLKKQYDERTDKINKANENSENLNTATSELKSYADKNIPKYAIGGGLSIILGLWISTIILYIKEKKSLFKE